jgi:dihydrofolate reductase
MRRIRCGRKTIPKSLSPPAVHGKPWPRSKPALEKDIWLFGEGSLFRNLAEDGLVDAVEVAIVPILLGAGVPLLSPPANRIKPSLTAPRVYKTGIVSLEYSIK